MKKSCVIPTYWGPIDEGEEIIFDHPTPLGTEGTLSRLIDNLLEYEEVRRGDIPVIIVGVANKKTLREACEQELERVLNPYENQLDIRLYAYQKLERIKKKLSEDSINPHLIEPDSYSQIRNLCLYAALESGADAGIFLDDDEILIDDDFFRLATDGLYKKSEDNGVIMAKAGYYEQERPSYRNFWELKWWPKDVSFNEAFDRLMDKTIRFKPSMVGLGGNMVMTKEVMQAICFDPLVNRGEDMDYVLNARFRGYRFYFDNQLRIKHLPPQKKTPMWKKAREDIYRFLFMRDKYNGHKNFEYFQKVADEEMQPYPGIFLRDDLEERIYEHNKQLGMKYLRDNDKTGFDECMENCKIPFVYQKRENAAHLYYNQLKDWEQITATV
ncbi:MAG: glycosyltransferase family 2 protein [Thermotogota bacterium]